MTKTQIKTTKTLSKIKGKQKILKKKSNLKY